MRVLVIGNSTRSIVCSARKAGHTVFALDRFGDVDMHKCAHKAESFGNVPENKLYELAKTFGDVDAVILGPGFEKLKFKNTLNNSLSVTENVNDKLKIAKKFSSMDIPHPFTELLADVSGAKFPLMIKPRFGSGGMLNVSVRNEGELENFRARNDARNFIAQEFIEGVPCSASLIGTEDDVSVIALNEQLIGVPWLTRLPFAYCGNITPFHTKFSNEMIKYATEIAQEFGLMGSNGVDFILAEKGVVVIEVNPRFQGSLDTIELSTGMNIFDAHVKSFTGELPGARDFACFAAKTIMYANKKVVVGQKLSDVLIKYMDSKRAADIPQPGSVIRPDEPVTTLLGTGKTREKALENVNKYAHNIKVITEA